jgi:hypothetical protein
MADKVEGYLEVGRNDRGEVVINHPDLKPDAEGVGHIVFSPQQARNLASLLLDHAEAIEPIWSTQTLFVIENAIDGSQSFLVRQQELKTEIHDQFCCCGNPDACLDEEVRSYVERLSSPDKWGCNSATVATEDGFVAVYRLSGMPWPYLDAQCKGGK